MSKVVDESRVKRRPRAAVLVLACVLGGGLVELAAQAGAFLLASYRSLPSEPAYSFTLSADQRAQLEQLVRHQNHYVRFDGELGWSIVPNGAGGRYRANASGLRGSRDYSGVPGGGATRIATYGDSFVHGDDVDNADTWQAQIEAAHADVEVLNFGVGGFGTDQAYLRYRREGTAGASVVVIGVMTENIARVVSRFRPYYYPQSSLPLAKPRFAVGPGGRVELVRMPLAVAADYQRLLDGDRDAFRELGAGDFYYERSFHASAFDLLATLKLARLMRYQLSGAATEVERVRAAAYDKGGESFRVLTAVIDAFAADVIRDGARPFVLLFPRLDDIERTLAGQAKWHEPLLEHLREGSLPWLDLTDAAAAEARSVGTAALIRGHFTPQGNRLVARTLFPLLIAERNRPAIAASE